MQYYCSRVALRRHVLGLLLVAAAGPAWADEGSAGVVPGHPTGHVHDRADQTWPPQPRGLRYEVPLSNPANAQRTAELRRRSLKEQARIALARPEVQRALGRRYSPPELVESGAKGAAGDGDTRLVYFSHENNRTVEVALDRNRVRSVRQIPPTEYQPDVTDEEIASAEVIARRHFSDGGKPRVAALQAYGILAYLPQGRGFYPTRVIYLTFHEADDSSPEFAAWVDLTRQRVIRTREEQR